MKKIFFALCVVLAFVSCKKDSSGGSDVESFKFNMGNDGKLAMTIGNMSVVSFTNEVTLLDVVITSSNDDVVYYSAGDGALVAKGLGTAIVTAALISNPEITATLEVTVTTYNANLKFYSVQWWGGSKEWDMKKYQVLRVRSSYNEVLPVDVSHYGDTADIQSWADEVDGSKWFYLYNHPETGDSMGLFLDSAYSLKTYVLSKECIFNGQGISLAGDQGMVLMVEDHFMFNSQAWYCLGGRYFVDDVTAVGKQYTKTGMDKVPYPNAIQVGHFNNTNYMNFFEEYFTTGTAPEMEDYPFFSDHDSYFYLFYMYDDEESETGKSMTGWYAGYPVLPETETDLDMYILIDDNTDLYLEYYYLNAMLFDNPSNWYGFKTEYSEEYGMELPVEPLELTEMKPYEYEGGELPTAKPGKNGLKRDLRREMPMPRKAAEKKLAYDRTVAAALRMVVTNMK